MLFLVLFLGGGEVTHVYTILYLNSFFFSFSFWEARGGEVVSFASSFVRSFFFFFPLSSQQELVVQNRRACIFSGSTVRTPG